MSETETEPVVEVQLADTEFTLTELEAFVARARSVDGIAHDALVAVRTPNASIVTKSGSGPLVVELVASTAFRGKA